MKVRMGFVSNSSTSSFCLYGAHVDNLGKVRSWDEDNEDEDTYYDSFWREARKLGLSWIDCREYDDGYYVGLDWTRIKDDETGKGFKERAADLVSQFFGKKVKCETWEGTYPS